jgi:hypothetical protein
MRGALWCVLLAGCAAGPRPVPSSLSPAERLAFAEEAVLAARATAAFEINSEGAHDSHLTGTLELTGSNALQLVAEGKFDREDVRVEMESLKGDINRSVTRGPSVNAHHAAPAPKLNEAIGVTLVRQGLLHDVAMLVLDRPIDKAEGGVREAVVASNVREEGTEQVDGEACHRLKWTLVVEGQSVGETSLCVSDATGLPLAREATLQLDRPMHHRERFTWTLKK